MTPDVRKSLERMLAAPEDERARILETLPAEIRAEVLELLQFEGQAASGAIDSIIADAARGFAADHLTETRVVPGMNLGPYRIEEVLGAGGMGTVYRAHDSRLDRTVALKVLASGRMVDSGWKLRFQREARAASLLSHPNIVTLYDIASQDGIDFLVFEYVTGKTLKELISASGLPLELALGLAAQIANGLAAAHAAGIVHRDIKPANVVVTAESRAKILDFGLAKLQPSSPLAGLETGHTASGIIMGTVTYMSPEQVSGHAVDHRTDIFSLGIVLYEMLCGARPFAGASPVDTLHAILNAPVTSVVRAKPGSPPEVDEILAKALAKDPHDRYCHAGDFELDLRRLIAASRAQRLVSRRPADGVPRRSWLRSSLLPATLTLVALAAGAALSWWLKPGVPSPLQRTSIVLPDGIHRPLYLALSSDGQQLAYVGVPQEGDASYIWVRPLEQPEARMLQGTAEARYPFWSPDRHALGFFAEGRLKTIDVMSGVIRDLCAAPDGAGGSWAGHTIVFASERHGAALSRVSDDGQGPPVAATVLQPSEATHVFPTFLADGMHFVFTAFEKNDVTKLEVGSLGDATTTADLWRGASPSPGNRRLPSQEPTQAFVVGGMLVFWRGGSVHAQALDERTWRLLGDPAVVVPNVADEDGLHRAFAVSNSLLVYRTDVPVVQRLTWLSRDGEAGTSLGEPAGYSQVELMRDDTQAIVTRSDGAKRALAVIDFARPKEVQPLTREGAVPLLSRDGLRVLFIKQGDRYPDIYSVRLDKGDDERVEVDTPESGKGPLGWSATGSLLYAAANKALRVDLWERPASGGARVLLPADNPDTGFGEAAATQAGDLIASIVGGKTARRLYVQPIRPGSARKLVATGSLLWEPRWRADGRELYYIDDSRHRLMAVDVDSADPVRIGSPHALLIEFHHWTYAPSRDGQRFLTAVPLASPNAPNVIDVMLNWPRVVSR